MLLLFYDLQRKLAFASDIILEFPRSDVNPKTITLRNDSEIAKSILAVSNQSAADAYNALMYLKDKRFIFFDERPLNTLEIFINLRVTGAGTDIVEGVVRDDEGRKNFNITFNIKLAENITIDSLIKGELGSILKLI